MSNHNTAVDPEFVGALIDVLDDFLENQHIHLPRSEKEIAEDGYDPQAGRIYGTDYDELAAGLSKVLQGYA